MKQIQDNKKYLKSKTKYLLSISKLKKYFFLKTHFMVLNNKHMGIEFKRKETNRQQVYFFVVRLPLGQVKKVATGIHHGSP